MSKILDRLSWLVTVRPYITLIVLLVVTVVLAAGVTFRAPPTEGADVAFLPPGHPHCQCDEGSRGALQGVRGCPRRNTHLPWGGDHARRPLTNGRADR